MSPEKAHGPDDLVEGAYDRLMTSRVERMLSQLTFEPSTELVPEAATPDALADHLRDAVRRRLVELHRGEDQLRLVNDILASVGESDEQVTGLNRLVSLRTPEALGQESRYPRTPSTPLGIPALLTNTTGDPALAHEIRGELVSADGVDLICAFIKWAGVRTLYSQLAAIHRAGVPLRVITTTYLGSTERLALDRLIKDFGAEVKINYEVNRTRLHAKAWLFRRATNYHTAYVGSSNLSQVALLDGLEWNVRLTQASTPALIAKFGATFDTYWNDPTFESYDPERDAERLDKALREAGGGQRDRVTLSLEGVEVRPYHHQQQVLEALEVEREVHGRHRNLLVAATGTGKTVIAALDYKALCAAAGRPLSLLFVAHRKEILDQARATYRDVLADPNFGELFVGGERPLVWRHVFASVQSMRVDQLATFDPSQFDVIVIDEFHHAAANGYQGLLDHFTPLELLGMTATPERTDGVDVRAMFDHRTAAEIRLWDALDAELLCPFHYFGINDETDLRSIEWKRGSYDTAQLEGLFTGNDARVRIILSQLRDKIGNLSAMRALGFCVGVRHAEYMARVFNEAGIPAAVVSGSTPREERDRALIDLKSRTINIIFTADLYNEGVDLPDIDTVLFLRPTESTTIFLQQLGRGLRRTPDKAVLTVLDFVGNQRSEFRFDTRFTAMTGISRPHLEAHVAGGFPHLPSGCQILLDRQSERQLLESLKRQTKSIWLSIVGALRDLGPVSLAEFIDRTGFELADVIKGNRSWSRACREAGLPGAESFDPADKLLERARAVAHVDDHDRAEAYVALLQPEAEDYESLGAQLQTYARMLLFSIWPKLPAATFQDSLRVLRANRTVCFEFEQVIRAAAAHARYNAKRLDGELAWTPLRSHAHYSRNEILAALDWATESRSPSTHREGVAWVPERNTDVFLINLDKDESHFTPTTSYKDYAISPTLFHWESQSTTTEKSPTGQRYVHQREDGHDVLLYTRASSSDDLGKGAPYLLLGQADYVSHSGEKPIATTWQLRRPMPDEHFLIAGVEAG